MNDYLVLMLDQMKYIETLGMDNAAIAKAQAALNVANESAIYYKLANEGVIQAVKNFFANLWKYIKNIALKVAGFFKNLYIRVKDFITGKVRKDNEALNKKNAELKKYYEQRISDLKDEINSLSSKNETNKERLQNKDKELKDAREDLIALYKARSKLSEFNVGRPETSNEFIEFLNKNKERPSYVNKALDILSNEYYRNIDKIKSSMNYSPLIANSIESVEDTIEFIIEAANKNPERFEKYKTKIPTLIENYENNICKEISSKLDELLEKSGSPSKDVNIEFDRKFIERHVRDQFIFVKETCVKTLNEYNDDINKATHVYKEMKLEDKLVNKDQLQDVHHLASLVVKSYTLYLSTYLKITRVNTILMKDYANASTILGNYISSKSKEYIDSILNE